MDINSEVTGCPWEMGFVKDKECFQRPLAQVRLAVLCMCTTGREVGKVLCNKCLCDEKLRCAGGGGFGGGFVCLVTCGLKKE